MRISVKVRFIPSTRHFGYISFDQTVRTSIFFGLNYHIPNFVTLRVSKKEELEDQNAYESRNLFLDQKMRLKGQPPFRGRALHLTTNLGNCVFLILVRTVFDFHLFFIARSFPSSSQTMEECHCEEFLAGLEGPCAIHTNEDASMLTDKPPPAPLPRAFSSLPDGLMLVELTETGGLFCAEILV